MSSRETKTPLSALKAKSVRELLMDADRSIPVSEMKVVRKLLDNYPAAGLTTISKLSQMAGVSDPTVLRLAIRLGFEGFSDLQKALLAEVEEHMRSPLTLTAASRLPSMPQAEHTNAYQSFLFSSMTQIEAAIKGTATADYERAVDLLTDPKLHILFIGGRFSRFIAGIMQRCLQHVRDGTTLFSGSPADVVDEMAGIGKRHVLVVFDFRRYQTDTVRFAEHAKKRNCKIILFTDQWKSPVADVADVIFSAPTETTSPFDTLTTPLLQAEAVIAGAAERLGDGWHERVAMIEQIRSDFHVTLDGNHRGARPKTKQEKTGSKTRDHDDR
jgi:DNA-binding MurR/RpiR family transcriptional regulator